MDNYPNNLAPAFEEGGGVATPFDEWWPKVKSEFPNVPEIIAKEWLHRHWGCSPFSWIPSNSYNFTLEKFSSDKLPNILNGQHNFELGGAKALDQGKYICGDHPQRPWRLDPIWLVTYMKEHMDFPSPIVILDNNDNHLENVAEVPEHYRDLPSALILVEGHRRHQIGLYLRSVKQLQDCISICRLTPV